MPPQPSTTRRTTAIALGLLGGVLASVILVWALGGSAGDVLRSLRGPLGARVRAIHQLDETVGHSLRPGTMFRHREDPFDVEYHVDESGSRRVPGYGASRPQVLVLGDSWTFGHGVEDDQTYAARLQQAWPERGVRNLGVMGYGTPHALLSLERALEVPGDVDLVLYGWTPIHLTRSYLRKTNLEATAGKRVPLLEIEKGRLVSKGLVGLEAAIPDSVPGLAGAEWRRTTAAIGRMRELVEARGGRFVLVVLPGPDAIPAFAEHSRRMRRRMDRSGQETVDLQGDPGFPKSEDLFFEDDGHPTSRWNALVAEALVARLDPPPTHR